MQALRCARRAVPALTLSPSIAQPLRSQSRTFTNLRLASRPSLEALPFIPSLSASTTLLRPTPYTAATSTTTTSLISNTLPALTRSFSASACLAGKRATYNPSRRVQKRRHGFLARLRTRSGREILKRRRLKGRKALSW